MGSSKRARQKARKDTVELRGEVILQGEKGRRFYYRALSPKAKSKKRKAGKQAKKSRRSNRG